MSDLKCRVCEGPLMPPPKDVEAWPDLPDAHAGCIPASEHWDAHVEQWRAKESDIDPAVVAPVSRAARDLPPGAMKAIWWSVCRGCNSRIEVGETQTLADVDGKRRWVCADCATTTAPRDALSAPQSAATVVPRPRISPDTHSANQPLSARSAA